MKDKRFYSILILPVIIQGSLFAQDTVALSDEPVAWNYGYLNDANTKMYGQNFGMTPKEMADFKVKPDNLVEVLHHNPVMANPRGFDAAVNSRPI